CLACHLVLSPRHTDYLLDVPTQRTCDLDNTPGEKAEPTERATTPATADSTPSRDPKTGLPVRRRGHTLAAAKSKKPTRTTSGPTTSAKGFGEFRNAVRGQNPTGSPKDT